MGSIPLDVSLSIKTSKVKQPEGCFPLDVLGCFPLEGNSHREPSRGKYAEGSIPREVFIGNSQYKHLEVVWALGNIEGGEFRGKHKREELRGHIHM